MNLELFSSSAAPHQEDAWKAEQQQTRGILFVSVVTEGDGYWGKGGEGWEEDPLCGRGPDS